MGCTSSCSGSSSPKQCSSARALLHTELTEQDLPRIETESKLQHISDRENAEDHILGHNPSDHPQTCTLFISKSQTDIQDRRKRLCVNQQHGRSRKIYSSCSTIFLDDNTVSRPNLKFTIKCVSLAIYYHIKNRDQKSHSLLDIFDEKLHPLSKGELPEDYDKQNPEKRQIYHFIQTLFNSARLSPECAIVTLVYLERLLSYAEITVCPRSWKRMVLGAILLASKVWDDQAVWNVDYCNILKHVTIQDMNELEREFLELLQFNINVPSSIYAKYYFDLRSLAEANNFTSPTLALSRDRALQLEAMSQLYDEYKNIKKILHKRSTSTDNLCVATWVPAILS